MKNKNIQKIFVATLVVLTSTTNFAQASIITLHAHSEMGKLLLAMFATVVFSVVCFVGLTLYNKFFVPPEIKNFKLNRDSLKTPQDKDEAILMFLSKNKLK